MKSQKLKSILTLAFATLLLASCNGNTNSSDTGGASSEETPTSQNSETGGETSSESASTSEDTSIIKEIVATDVEAVLYIDEKKAYSSFYEVVGNQTLTSKQKQVTVTSSDSTIIEVSGRQLVANALGSCDITITSAIETDKSLTLTFTVKDVYFDRSLGYGLDNIDFSSELNEDGTFNTVTTAESSAEFYVRGSLGTYWMETATLKLNSVLSTESYPKIGLLTATEGEQGLDNMTGFFIDLADFHNNTSWANLGFVEVRNSQWAWDINNDNLARHLEGGEAGSLATPYTVGEEITFTLIRDHYNLHFLCNGTYRFSIHSLSDLFTVDGAEVATYAGIMEFNSAVTVTNASFSNDETTVAAAITALGELNYIKDLA